MTINIWFRFMCGALFLASCAGDGADMGGSGGNAAGGTTGLPSVKMDAREGSGGTAGSPINPSGNLDARGSGGGGAGNVGGNNQSGKDASASEPVSSVACDPKFLAPFCESAGSQKMRIIGFNDAPYPATPTISDVRKFSLDAVNALRARTCLKPLAAADCLDKIGAAANEAVATLGIHGYFKANCLNSAHGFGKSCECGWAQENFGSAGGSSRTWKDGIIVPLCAMMEEPKGQGHRSNIESAEWTRMGSGVTWSPSSAQWCHEFGR